MSDDEPRMSDERFAAWVDEIGLTPMQRDRVRYVIDREYERGRVAGVPPSPRLETSGTGTLNAGDPI